MSDRFYSSQPITAERVTLDGSEAHHLLNVMRATVGTSVTLFDGNGAEFEAVVEAVGRADATLRIVESREIDRELPARLVVGVSLPKGDRQKWLVEKLTELGVTELVPLVVERGVAQPTDSAIERLHRSVIEATKQCGRNRLMRIAPPQAWSEWISDGRAGWLGSSASEHPAARPRVAGVELAAATEPPPAGRRLLAHPSGQPLSQIDLGEQVATQVAIGPEGGFTDAEVTAADSAGWSPVSLGPRILRVETAAVVLAAACALR